VRQRGLFIISVFTLFVAASGCAHRGKTQKSPELTEGLHSIKASAVVELTKEQTEKGRAFILASNPDSFNIEIKGPFGITIARITGNKKGLTLLRKGKSTTYRPDDARIPLNIIAVEFVSLLMGKENLDSGNDASFEIKKIPGGKIITKHKNGVILYRATMTQFHNIEGFSLPFAIAIKGGGYTLLVKYVSVDINPKIK